jgi:hypothetical protein
VYDKMLEPVGGMQHDRDSEQDALRGEIPAFCMYFVLNQRAVTLCETEATPKQEEFLQRVLAGEKYKTIHPCYIHVVNFHKTMKSITVANYSTMSDIIGSGDQS